MATNVSPVLFSVSNLPHFFIVYTLCLLVFCSLNFNLCYGIRARHFNLSTVATHWSTAGATWYGSPQGAGSDGGSCGYGDLVSQPPFSSMITGIGPSLYNSGKECGACYQVKCTKHPSCSGKPARVVITDFCPGCTTEKAHFDLSGTSFGAMAIPGQEKHLRDAGILEIRFARVACDYAGTNIAFHVDQGSNSNYIAFVVEFEEGDGDIGAVGLMETTSSSKTSSTNGQVITTEWRGMQQSWGAVWKLDAGGELKPPLSIQLTSQYTEQTIVAKNVIPVGWKPGATYRSVVNFL
ncbi:hypothetical protein DCAR_0520709 [Daucus carota subsp. sativus]|uniref:Uncharacterized protein n=1 Tax=Daucus carota subsp. sativus TaxID=79200 RepID=A0A164YQJ8_DAUCS|nr:PREDICTED: putative expansin-B2 [Daucus carota subsp. sativus]WOH01327.1 hypothetical protein DCAR_0520709 [Daucus carota subsp. sativus]